MEALKAEIARKRKFNDSIRAHVPEGKDEQIGKSRFIRQADLKIMVDLELKKQQETLDAERNRRIDLDSLNRKITKDITENRTEKVHRKEFEGHYSTLTVQEIKNRLRNIRQPVTLFGESVQARIDRFAECMLKYNSESREDDDIRVIKNQNADDEEEAELEAEDLADAAEEGYIASTRKFNNNTDSAKQGFDNKSSTNDGDEDNEEDDNDNNDKSKDVNKLEWDHTIHFSKMAGLSAEKIVYKFFRCLVKQWESDLHHREDWEKRTAKGKMETRTQKQCKDYIRPLFRMCMKNEVPYDILDKLALMVKLCEEGNFLAANDQYIRTAIGNSAWPIGLTMVGIHERSGREKISTSKVAHIMNNELQRKYLTSIKRLMTYAQTKRVDVAPSMKLLNK